MGYRTVVGFPNEDDIGIQEDLEHLAIICLLTLRSKD